MHLNIHHTILREYRTIIASTAVLLVALFGFFAFTAKANAQEITSKERHVLSLYDGGEKKGIITDKHTLREALKEANVELAANDVTEPALDDKLVAASYEVNIYRARPVSVVDDGMMTKIMTPYRTAKQIAEQAGMKLQDEDIATLRSSSDILRDGAVETLLIKRATPVEFIFYGKRTTVYTQEKTVGAMLKSKKITLKENDFLSVSEATAITSSMTVELWRNGKQTITEEKEIDFPVRKIQDKNQEMGYKKVEKAGVKGSRTVTYDIVMKNGKEESRQEVKSITTKEPVEQVEIVGTKSSNTFSGSFAEALARLRSCEGSYTSNTGNGYYGAYQFDIQTWGGYGGYPHAAAAPPDVQDQKAWETYQRRGWQPWPSCKNSQGLQDIYR